jgi:hypothetical protein
MGAIDPSRLTAEIRHLQSTIRSDIDAELAAIHDERARERIARRLDHLLALTADGARLEADRHSIQLIARREQVRYQGQRR